MSFASFFQTFDGKIVSESEKLLKTNDKENNLQLEILLSLKNDLENGQLINLKNFNENEQKIIKSFQLLSSKPTFFIGNINDSENYYILIFLFLALLGHSALLYSKQV